MFETHIISCHYDYHPARRGLITQKILFIYVDLHKKMYHQKTTTRANRKSINYVSQIRSGSAYM